MIILLNKKKINDCNQYVIYIHIYKIKGKKASLFSFFVYFCTINIQIKSKNKKKKKKEEENHRRVTLLRSFQWHDVYTYRRHIQPFH